MSEDLLYVALDLVLGLKSAVQVLVAHAHLIAITTHMNAVDAKDLRPEQGERRLTPRSPTTSRD